MSHRKTLTIREKPETMQTYKKFSKEVDIKTCCCISQGISKFDTNFNKNVFKPLETAEATVKIDNS